MLMDAQALLDLLSDEEDAGPVGEPDAPICGDALELLALLEDDGEAEQRQYRRGPRRRLAETKNESS